jgi:hypothetical protein
MEHAFPTLPEVWQYLKGKIDAGKLSKVAHETPATAGKQPNTMYMVPPKVDLEGHLIFHLYFNIEDFLQQGRLDNSGGV